MTRFLIFGGVMFWGVVLCVLLWTLYCWVKALLDRWTDRGE